MTPIRLLKGGAILFLVLSLIGAAGPVSGETSKRYTFNSLLTRDLANLAPDSRFSLSDRIHLYTVWTGLKGSHQLVVKWIRPDGKVQETTRFKFTVPENSPNYRTWAWLEFKKSLMNIPDSRFIGPWKARLFLDTHMLSEYEFQVF